MAQTYKLVARHSIPGDVTSVKKYYATSVNNGYTTMEYLCTIIGARSAVSSADVKAVLDSLNFILVTELKEGRIVQLGEFGNFRISISSEGTSEKKDFQPSMIRGTKILFSPGKALKEMHRVLNFFKIPGLKLLDETEEEGI